MANGSGAVQFGGGFHHAACGWFLKHRRGLDAAQNLKCSNGYARYLGGAARVGAGCAGG